jgi:predicted transcriptional regulator
MSKYLIQNEKVVYNFIQEYLDKNRYYSAYGLINFINSRCSKASININVKGIKRILESFLKKNLIAEKSSFTKDNVLLNSNRQIILSCITKNPGIHFNKIYKKLNLSVAVVEWHLNILTKFDFIRKEHFDNYDAYFDSSLDPELDKIRHIISREKCRKIIEYLKTHNEGTTKYHLSNELGLHSTTVTKYVNYLDEFGFLIKKKLTNKIIYFLSEDNYFKHKKSK